MLVFATVEFWPAIVDTHIGMSACCSLDEPREAFLRQAPIPSSSQPDRPGLLRARASYLAHNEAGAPARPDTADPAAPRRSSAGECLPLHGAPWWPQGRGHGRQARFPHQGACTGGSRPWFPSLRLVFQKCHLTATTLVGATGFEPVTPRL